jgi:hypothetical protein
MVRQSSAGSGTGKRKEGKVSRQGQMIPMQTAGPAFERHYRISELAELWSLGRETVRLLVKDDPAVIKIRLGRNKRHTTYSVPESAAQRIHTKLQHGR